MAAQKAAAGRNVVAQNRKARHDYAIENTVEAGLMLMGSEVKSLRLGRCTLGEAYAGEQSGGFFLLNVNIPEYAPANRYNHPPKRPRKLLLRKREMVKLMAQVKRDGYTIVPLSIYFNDRGFAKCELGIGKGKKAHDKRHAIKDREWKRDKSRLMSHRR